MRRASVGLLLLGVLATAACHKDAPTATNVADAGEPPDASMPLATTIDAAPMADAASVDAASDVDAGTYPTEWNDPRLVAAIAQSCAFDPDDLPYEEQTRRFGPHRDREDSDDMLNDLGCEGNLWPQSCSPDPCFEGKEDGDCRHGCQKTCDHCGDTCVATCNGCEAKCTDDACRLACAKNTVDCRTGCLHKRDACGDQTCPKVLAACYARVSAEFQAAGCAAACTSYDKCFYDCLTPPMTSDKCQKKCSPKGLESCDWSDCSIPEIMNADAGARSDAGSDGGGSDGGRDASAR